MKMKSFVYVLRYECKIHGKCYRREKKNNKIKWQNSRDGVMFSIFTRWKAQKKNFNGISIMVSLVANWVVCFVSYSGISLKCLSFDDDVYDEAVLSKILMQLTKIHFRMKFVKFYHHDYKLRKESHSNKWTVFLKTHARIHTVSSK